MYKNVFFAFFLLLPASAAFAQELPFGACGIVNVYDAAGNRTKREYFCNNGVQPYPSKTAKQEIKEVMEFQPVEALYPNPTTGKFSITFSKALKGASLTLSDLSGKTVQQFKASGHKVDFDLSKLAAGVYLVRIGEGKNSITKKVVKQ